MASFYGTDLDNSQTAGFDNYYGGDGNDFLLGTAGINAVYGGQGNDVVGGANFTSFTGLGTLVSPYVLVLGAASGNDFLDGDAGADIAYGGDGDDTINGGDGDDSGNITSYSGQVFVGGLFGGDGNDFIDGGAGNDLLDGGAGNDSLSGGDGNDQLRGGAGTDLLKGGSGNDVYNVEDALDVIVEGADEGTDLVFATASYTLAPNAAIEFLTSAGVGLSLTGSNTGNTITGDTGDNFLSGLAGEDSLFGLDGNDILRGGLDNDFLVGGNGNDRLFGDGGRDILTGGAGNDIFAFSSKPDKVLNVDRITDFNSADDTFWLDNAFLTRVGSNGKLKSDAFHLGKRAEDAQDRVIYDKGTGNLCLRFGRHRRDSSDQDRDLGQ